MVNSKQQPTVSIIVPVLNEADQLPELIAHLQYWRGRECEVLIVDGGSDDDTAKTLLSEGFPVLRSARGRAKQMNAGAAAARGGMLVFLHADTRLPADADRLLSLALEETAGGQWGRFDVRITGEARMLRVIAWCMNQRSRWTGIATGDQAMFVRQPLFAAFNGFPEQPLMEDVELSQRLRRTCRPLCLREVAMTSGRRWQTHGVWATIFLMWRLRWAYWRGVPAETLAGKYR